MEAFHLLSRGGVKFNKTKFKGDVRLFNVSFLTLSMFLQTNLSQGNKAQEPKASTSASASGELPPELNFFKYAEGGAPKRKAPSADIETDVKGKKRKVEADEDEGTDEEDVPMDDESPMPRHRVTTKGNNVPEHADTFEALRDRYNIPPHLFANLAESGYKRPTGIQSYGVPILMEVRPSPPPRILGAYSAAA